MGVPNVRLAASIALCVAGSVLAGTMLFYQPPLVDFLPMWTAGRMSLEGDVGLIYDFNHISQVQGWQPDHQRPYVHPPTGLLIFALLAALPFLPSYLLWLVLTVPLLAWAGRRVGAPIWFLFAPWMVFSLFCGQIVTLLAALLLLGLWEREHRPVVAGVLFGIAAAIKPQLLILLPVALAADGRWRVIITTGATGLVLCAVASLIWGIQPWLDWLVALSSFSDLIAGNARLNEMGITPAAALRHFGFDGRWALLLIPPAGVAVWMAFRRQLSFEDRLIIFLGATFLVSPYAMHYELAFFAPAVAIYLSRIQDRSWYGYLMAASLEGVFMPPAVLNLLTVLALPVIRRTGRLVSRADAQPSSI